MTQSPLDRKIRLSPKNPAGLEAVLRPPARGRDLSRSRFLIEKQAEDPLPLGGGMNAVPTAFETEAK